MKKGSIIALTVGLGVTVVALTVALIIFIITTSTYSTQLENTYKRSFYELSTNINDLEVDISKLIATTTPDSQKVILQDIYNTSNVANTNISNLPISNKNIKDINSFVNRLGGFSYALIEKLNDEQKWSEADIASINELHSYSLNLLFELNNYIRGFDVNYSIIKQIKYNDEDKSEFNNAFENIQGTNSKVPTLIYDGPFADSVLNPDIKGLPQNPVSKEQAQQIVQENMKMYEFEKVEFESETNGMFATYNFNVFTKDLKLFVQVTKKGGVILEITSIGSGGDKALTRGESENVAKAFSVELGYRELHAVWSTINGDIAYVNLAPIENGVIYYPDLIKVKVDRKLGLVTGWEAKNYCYNHAQRQLPTASITFAQAEQKISPLLKIVERNRALVPIDYKGEKLTYEFVCTWKDYTYYVYIDVQTGAEVNILRIIKTTSGDLII